MKIAQEKPDFKKITIVLETGEDARNFIAIIDNALINTDNKLIEPLSTTGRELAIEMSDVFSIKLSI